MEIKAEQSSLRLGYQDNGDKHLLFANSQTSGNLAGI